MELKSMFDSWRIYSRVQELPNDVRFNFMWSDRLSPENLEYICDELFPFENKSSNEDYEDLHFSLIERRPDILTVGHLLGEMDLNHALKEDKVAFKRELKDDYYTLSPRQKRNEVFYTHVGLMRTSIRWEGRNV